MSWYYCCELTGYSTCLVSLGWVTGVDTLGCGAPRGRMGRSSEAEAAVDRRPSHAPYRGLSHKWNADKLLIAVSITELDTSLSIKNNNFLDEYRSCYIFNRIFLNIFDIHYYLYDTLLSTPHSKKISVPSVFIFYLSFALLFHVGIIIIK